MTPHLQPSSVAVTAPAMRPRVSVVLPTHRQPAALLRCLHALLEQSVPAQAFEVIVVDDAHDHATRVLVEQLRRRVHASRRPALRYLRPSNGRGPAVARNAGWRAARAELIAFLDDDTVPAREWLAQGERASRPTLAAVRGRLVASGRSADREPTMAGAIAANLFVRRSALERLGGFDERFTRPWRDDADLQLRLEQQFGPVGRCDEAVVFDRHEARAPSAGGRRTDERHRAARVASGGSLASAWRAALARLVPVMR